MSPSKSESVASNGKTAPLTPKITKTTRNGSTKFDSGSPSSITKLSSPVPKLRSSVERSPKSAESKLPPTKSSPTLDKQKRASKGLDLQAKLIAVAEDLKKAKEQLASMEQEKLQAIEELKEAEWLTKEANEKLHEAIAGKNAVEESLEIEKFRSDELEQVGIEDAKRRDEEQRMELEHVRNQHALDSSALLAVTEELEKVKFELLDAINAKKNALSEAEDAKKIAEENEYKVDALSREVSHLKSLLDSKLDNMNKEAAEMIKRLNEEIGVLQLELKRLKSDEERLPKMKALFEQLQKEVTDAKKAESDTFKQVNELRNEVASLKIGLKEANQSERSAIESLAITMKKVEEGTVLLQDAETEVALLQGKVESMEIEVARCKKDMDDSDGKLDLSQEEILSLGRTLDILKTELKKLEDEKLQAFNNGKISAADIERILEEKCKFVDALNASRSEVENDKKALEGLTSALHEMSTEASENQERLLAKQSEVEDAKAHIEQLNSELKNTEERYEIMLDETRYEIACLKKTAEKFETETRNSRNEWERKELNFINAIKKSDDEIASLKVKLANIINAIKVSEQEAQAAKARGAEMLCKLKQAEATETTAHEVAEEAKARSLRLKERLLDKENELQNITQENDDLRFKETTALQKIQELSSLLEEATSKRNEETRKLPKNESITEKPNSEVALWKHQNDHKDCEKLKEENEEEKQNDRDEGPMDIMPKDLASGKDHKEASINQDIESKMNNSNYEETSCMTEGMDCGATSPTKNQRQKKKKPLLHKFGSLLKKGGNKGHTSDAGSTLGISHCK